MTKPFIQEVNSEERAKQALLKERQVRTEKCSKEIASILSKYKCTFQVQMIIEANRITPVVTIISTEG
jgi:hypothetical protein